MDVLYEQLLNRIIRIKLVESDLKTEIPICVDVTKVINDVCYKTLVAIRDVLDDRTLNDRECFNKIEEIVSLYESLGSDGGSRHDFG